VVHGEFEQADATLAEAIAMGRATGDAFSLSWSLLIDGMLSRARRQHDRAATSLRESLAIAKSVERASYRAFAVTRSLVPLGCAESERGASAEARAVFKEALVGMRDSGLTGWLFASCLDWLAAELGRAGEPLRAARLFGAADAQWRRAGARRFPIEESLYDNDVRGVHVQLDEPEFARAWNEGRSMAVAQVFTSALDALN
jgi:hypothetical protein